MKIALIMNHNNYAGREFMDRLINNNIVFDVISIGTYPAINNSEDERCGNLWRPKPFEILVDGLKCCYFKSLKDDELISFLSKETYDLGIQGGAGIIKEDIINKFKIGILNFHPGDLPRYRGCSAPEWQLFENKPVICTCHLVDKGIDTGDVYKKKELDVDLSSYHKMRASIYPRISEFVAETCSEIIVNNGFAKSLKKQDENYASYRPYIGDEKINFIKSLLSERSYHE